VPLILIVLLLSLPFVSFCTGAKSLLRGLFDLTPLSMFVVTLTTMALSGTACMTAYLILRHGGERIGIGPFPGPLQNSWPWWGWVLTMILLSSPIVLKSALFSAGENHSRRSLLLAALLGTLLAGGMARELIVASSELVPKETSAWIENKIAGSWAFVGYAARGRTDASGHSTDPWQDHVCAGEAFLFTLGLYVLIGIYGGLRLGKSRTVPALCSALMLATMIGWMLAAITFFFDLWHVPALIIVLIVGTITAQSQQSDHFYDLKDKPVKNQAPDPGTVAHGTRRLILAAANGGGIQAGAWAAQVLAGLQRDCGEKFAASLRMISSVSGGSVGNACFVGWLADPAGTKPPDEAASESSLDEVAWGLAWPDFIRALFPWISRRLIGRGRALEIAWSRNIILQLGHPSPLDAAMSNWNDRVAHGQLPAVVMNGTIAETGERLLMATTHIQHPGRARVDAADLHVINGQPRDIAAVTAARLSATFPYVTPASRSDAPGPRPHIVDGGYYDNYGMSTLVEWLDEALTTAGAAIDSVLVIQIHGAPVGNESALAANPKEITNRGWFYQAIVPLLTLDAVRSSGQIAHNDIELSLLRQKWAAKRNLPIHSMVFEFPNEDAPLSWHLTHTEIEAIRSAWNTPTQARKRALVCQFIDGNDDLHCGCPQCNSASSAAPSEVLEKDR